MWVKCCTHNARGCLRAADRCDWQRNEPIASWLRNCPIYDICWRRRKQSNVMAAECTLRTIIVKFNGYISFKYRLTCYIVPVCAYLQECFAYTSGWWSCSVFAREAVHLLLLRLTQRCYWRVKQNNVRSCICGGPTERHFIMIVPKGYLHQLHYKWIKRILCYEYILRKAIGRLSLYTIYCHCIAIKLFAASVCGSSLTY